MLQSLQKKASFFVLRRGLGSDFRKKKASLNVRHVQISRETAEHCSGIELNGQPEVDTEIKSTHRSSERYPIDIMMSQ